MESNGRSVTGFSHVVSGDSSSEKRHHGGPEKKERTKKHKIGGGGSSRGGTAITSAVEVEQLMRSYLFTDSMYVSHRQ